MSLSLFTFSALMGFSSRTKHAFLFWFKSGYTGALLFWVFILHFYIVITKVIKIRKILYLILYIPFIVLMYRNISGILFYKDFYYNSNGWTFITDMESFWTYFYLVFITINTLISMTLLLIWRIKSKTIKEKRQSMVLFVTLAVMFIAGNVEAVVIPSFTSYESSGLSPVIFVIWMSGIFFTIIKYRFMTLTPKIVSESILKNIDESIILTDHNYKILKINRQAEEILDYKNENVLNHFIGAIIKEDNSIMEEIDKLFKKKIYDFSIRLNFINKNDELILMDSKISIIYDKFNDFNGMLLIGKEVKEAKRLKEIYDLTKREMQIIPLILSGNTNKDIAETLKIAERTIKGHISHIYMKLMVKNKVQLINLLKEYNLIPKKQAETTLLLLKKKTNNF